MYPELAVVFRQHGYALAVHGSLRRDFDLVAVPWVEKPSPPEVVVKDILATWAIKLVGEGGTPKLHGRRCWTLSIGWGSCAIDLSFMPTSCLVLA